MANYGDRARIGMLLPSVNRAAEPQITEMLPTGVSLHTTRLRQSSEEEHINEMAADVERGAVMLADADVDLIVFHCTAASMFALRFRRQHYRPDRDRNWQARDIDVEGLSSRRSRTVGAKKITFDHPYIQVTNRPRSRVPRFPRCRGAFGNRPRYHWRRWRYAGGGA